MLDHGDDSDLSHFRIWGFYHFSVHGGCCITVDFFYVYAVRQLFNFVFTPVPQTLLGSRSSLLCRQSIFFWFYLFSLRLEQCQSWYLVDSAYGLWSLCVSPQQARSLFWTFDKAPIPLAASRHDTTSTTFSASRDVTCRDVSCCVVLVPTWQTTKKQYCSRHACIISIYYFSSQVKLIRLLKRIRLGRP